MKTHGRVILVLVLVAGAAAYLFWPSESGSVQVECSSGKARVMMRGAWLRPYVLESGRDPVGVPAGRYGLAQVRVSQVQGSDSYEITGMWPVRKGSVWVRPNETAVIKAGPPLTLGVEVMRQGPVVSMNPRIAGAGGESYPATGLKNGRRAAPPKVRVLDEAGKVLAEGVFAFG